MSHETVITRNWSFAISLVATFVTGLVLAQNNTPYCQKTVQHTVGEEPIGHASCTANGLPCNQVNECEVSDTCGSTPPGEGLQSCGSPTTVTTTCTSWTNGICKNGKCYRTGASIQIIPGLSLDITRYLSPVECGEN